MDNANLLSPASVRCEPRVGSKKHALEILSELLANAGGGLTSTEVLDGLVSRERLGSTGLGRAIAMPHTKQSGVHDSVGAVLKLEEAVDFNAPDGEPVDLLFGLLVPEGSDSNTVADVLERVRSLCRPEVRRQLDECGPRRLYELCSETLGEPKAVS